MPSRTAGVDLPAARIAPTGVQPQRVHHAPDALAEMEGNVHDE